MPKIKNVFKKMNSKIVLKSLLLYILFFASLTVTAQNDQKFFNKGVSKVRNIADKIARSKFDSTYVALPEHEWMVFTSFNGNASKYHLRVPMPDMEKEWSDDLLATYPNLHNMDLYTYDMDLHHNNMSVSVGVAYRTIRLKYSFNVTKGNDQQFTAESLGSRFGFMINYRKTKKMKGDMYNAMTGFLSMIANMDLSKEEDINVDDVIKAGTAPIEDRYNDYQLLHLQAHYVFNYKHFSYSAGRSASRIQKKSAGSPIALIDFYQSRAKFADQFIVGVNERYKTWKFAIGGGYGYNFTPNAGKLLIHASALPTINILRNSTYHTTFVYPEEYDKMSEEAKQIYQKNLEDTEKQVNDMVDKTPKITLNFTARLSATWNIDKHFVLGAFGSFQHSNFINKKDYSIRENFYSGSVWLGYRF